MKLRLPSTRRRTGAFSLLEMMIAVGMLTVVVFALYAMFDQTQKALRQSLNQAEISEGGRAALDLVVRSVERAASPQVEDALHLVIKPADAVGYELVFQGEGLQASRTQPLRFDELFFTYPIPGNLWHVAGLFVGPDGTGPASSGTAVGLATLYLIDESLPNTNLVRILDEQIGTGIGSDPAHVLPMRLTGPPAVQTNLVTSRVGTLAFAGRETSQSRADAVRLLEGVIQFKVTAYDADGRPFDRFHPIIYDLTAPRVGVNTNRPVQHVAVSPAAWQATNRVGNVSRPLPVTLVNINPDTSQVTAQFRGTNIPSALEIEVTLLDGKQLDQFRSLPNTVQVRNRWLANNSGALQTLRQRVALRTAPQ
jgi:type II secretory pathway pseudopilin PulG